ncbi:MAG: hypothetical protein QY316_12895 [Thermodesulfobacteriota bacterium]|nr:MAG: hypothetical protein QY316_12895 [Thermodesulfobacteriota bacterium]
MGKTLFIGGANRGGSAVSEAVLAGGFLDTSNQVLIADPKEERAERLALTWSNNGVPATGLKEPCETAIEKIRPDRAILSIDTLKPMAQILNDDSVPTQWQLLARGPGSNGAVIGLSGTVTKGDENGRRSSAQLIEALADFIKPQSSRTIRDNLLNADALNVARRKVSLHSARRLAVLDREPQDITGGTLNLHWGDVAYPLAVQERHGKRWSESRDQVLDAGKKADKTYSVALIEKNNVEFFIVEDVRGKRLIRFHLPLSAPKQSSNGNAGLSTILGAVAVAALAAPLVTD